jgi:hypothetical protein
MTFKTQKTVFKQLLPCSSHLILQTGLSRAIKKSIWHDSHHVKDTRFKGISRKDVAMLNQIGLVSDLLWHLFLDSLSEIFSRFQAYESIWQKSAIRWHKTKTSITRTRIPRRENELPTSYLHCGVHSPISLQSWVGAPVSSASFVFSRSSHLLLLTNPDSCVNLFPCLFL